jgi:hypothetical protein
MATDPDLDSADDLVDDDEALLDEDLPIVYDAQTERLKVYATLLRVTLPKIGATTRVEFGKEAEIDPDVCSARNLAIMAIFADIRRITGSQAITAHPDVS